MKARSTGSRSSTSVKNRGVEDVCLVVCDGLKGLPDSVNTVWPDTLVQTCIVHYADVRVMPMMWVVPLRRVGSALARSA